MPPPNEIAVFPERVELVMVRVPLWLLFMPPPMLPVFPESVELVTVRVPLLLMPPP